MQCFLQINNASVSNRIVSIGNLMLGLWKRRTCSRADLQEIANKLTTFQIFLIKFRKQDMKISKQLVLKIVFTKKKPFKQTNAETENNSDN